MDKTEYSYDPIIKGRGFNPKPVNGQIPFWADSLSNPKCVGTAAWEEWWLEQFYYFENGYWTGGMWIPPAYYFWLNFIPIKGLVGTVYPDYVDMQYQIFKTRDEVRADPSLSGLIIPKARRKGMSIIGDACAAHGMRFIEDYRMGVAGGLERYVNGFRQKLYMSYNSVPPELKLNFLRRNENELSNGYEVKGQDNVYDEIVTSLLMFQTLKDQAAKLEGEFFHDVIFEEMGQFENSDSAYESIRPALELGELIKGLFMLYGTGGNMLKGSKAFKEFWHNADSYGLVRIFISGSRYYFPYYRGAKDDNGQPCHKTPNLDAKFPDLSPEQLMGCEDQSAAEKSILDERLRRAKNPNKKLLVEWNQKYPLTVEEVFASSGVNNFDTDLLYNQQYRMDAEARRYQEYCLDFVKDDNGQFITPLKVTARLATDKDADWEKISILADGHPTGHKNLDVGGLDGYNEDLTQTTRSLGGIVVVRRWDEYEDPNKMYDTRLPVCYYLKRPPRKELHWEIGLKIAVYYDLIRNMMISAESDMVIQYFKTNLGKKFLSPRPKAFDAPDTKQQHDYGAKMTTFSKPRMLSLLQTFVVDCIHNCWFPGLIMNFLAYDYENIGTDWDDVDALGMALMRIVDMKVRPTAEVDHDKLRARLDLPEYEEENGVIRDTIDRYEEEEFFDEF